jgi:hypothetical protein
MIWPSVRTYPASGGSIMLPLTPANNWTATVLYVLTHASMLWVLTFCLNLASAEALTCNLINGLRPGRLRLILPMLLA